MATSAIAEFINVTKDYRSGIVRRGTLRAVDNVSLKIPQGQVFGLMGPNRAGKTTLIKLLLSLCRPTSGQVSRLGQPATNRQSLARVGYVHENHAFPRYFNATSLLHYYGALSLLPEEIVQQRVPQLLEKVGLADRAREPISRFSKGMIQRLGVAQALINDPDLLVLDEPSEGLDLIGRQMIHQMAEDLRKQGKTILLVSHVLTEVKELCDAVAVIVGGKIVYKGSLKKLPEKTKGDNNRTLEQAMRDLYESNGSKSG